MLLNLNVSFPFRLWRAMEQRLNHTRHENPLWPTGSMAEWLPVQRYRALWWQKRQELQPDGRLRVTLGEREDTGERNVVDCSERRKGLNAAGMTAPDPKPRSHDDVSGVLWV